MLFKNRYVKITNTIILLFLLIRLLGPVFSPNQKHIPRRSACDHIIPFSWKRLVRYKYQATATQIIYNFTFIKYNIQYLVAVMVENYKVFSVSIRWKIQHAGVKQLKKTTSPNVRTGKRKPEYREELAQIIQVLEPHQQKVAERINHKCVLESIRFNKAVKHFVSTQILEWYRLVRAWNEPLLSEDENGKPCQYQEDADERKHMLLTLRHKTRLKSLQIRKLYQYQEQEVIALTLPIECINYYQDPTYNELFDYIDFIREQRNHDLKMRIHSSLATMKDTLMISLEKSFQALNESIFIEKGQYYHVLHPDSQYMLEIDEQNWRSLIKSIEIMWSDALMTTTKPSWSLWEWLQLLLDYLKKLAHYLGIIGDNQILQ